MKLSRTERINHGFTGLHTLLLPFFFLCFLLPAMSVFATVGDPCTNSNECGPTEFCENTTRKCEECKADFGCFESNFPGVNARQVQTFIKNNPEPILKLVSLAINTVIGILIVLGIIFIVVGGYLYLVAGGDNRKIDKGKEYITHALLGLLLALTAWIILNTISPQFASDLKEPCIGTSCP